MDKILLKSVVMPGSEGENAVDVLIAGNRFARIGVVSPEESLGAEVVDCSGFAILPAFYNGHTHAAMSLLRGYADDMELETWLSKYIWPFESKLTDEAVYIGSRLAVLEMIKSGTVFFADMYWRREQTIRAVEEMGIRAAIGVTIADTLMTPEQLELNFDFLEKRTGESDRVKLVVMPHSVYTVSENVFRRCIDFAKANGYKLHTHLCETRTEVDNCIKQYGVNPLELVERLGGLTPDLIAEHCVQFTESDRKKFAQAGATAVLNPSSNLKLASGIPDVPGFLRDGVKVALGTDGASSNNSLDMHAEMKLVSLLSKVQGGATSLPAQDALRMATSNVARAYGLGDVGEVREGNLADCLLVDLKNERMVPRHNLVSNLVYAADNSSIDSVICNGKFVMRGHHVDGEEEIMQAAEACAKRLAAN